MRQIKHKVKVILMAASTFIIAGSSLAFKATHRLNGVLFCGTRADHCTTPGFTSDPIHPDAVMFCNSTPQHPGPNAVCIEIPIRVDS